MEKTIRATHEEHELLYFIRGAKISPEQARVMLIQAMAATLGNNALAAAAPASAPPTVPKEVKPKNKAKKQTQPKKENKAAAPSQPEPEKKRQRVDNYMMLRDAGVPVPEARKHRYSPIDTLINVIEKYSPKEKEQSPSPNKQKVKNTSPH